MSVTTIDHSTIHKIRKQQTFCLIKPDGVVRGLTGEIIRRIEQSGLKVIALKMVQPTRDLILQHYPMSDQAWIDRLGDKRLSTFSDLQIDANEFLGTDDRSKLGQSIADSLVEYMTSSPVVCMIVEGVQAVDMIRKLAGHTLPFKAEMGTIRGDWSVDSPAIAHIEGRAIHNLFHASETQDEATKEIALWFSQDEIQTYTRSGEDVAYSKTY